MIGTSKGYFDAVGSDWESCCATSREGESAAVVIFTATGIRGKAAF